MDFSEFLKVDGTTLPIPSAYNFDIEDLSSEATGRTLDGIMHKDVVGVKVYIQCSWKKLSWQDASTVLMSIDGKTQVTLNYVDPRVPNQILQGQFYVGKRGGVALNVNDPNRTWQDISFTFIQI